MKSKPSSVDTSKVLRRLALYCGIGLFSLYVLVVAASYAWLHFGRHNDEVRLADVALARLGAIRRTIAAQHFVNAKKEWDANRIQAAYLYFSAGVRQDPANVSGRLQAVQFLRSVGGGNLALVMLEEGLAVTPDDRRLIETTFGFLLSTGRDRRALDLLKKHYGSGYAGNNGLLLQRYEVQATLTADGAPAARKLLDRYTGLYQEVSATPVVARVLWETQERTRAISLLQGYVQTPVAVYADFAQMAAWQTANGQASDAVQTARRASEKFPHELEPRVLMIEMLVANPSTAQAGQEAIGAYLRDFGRQPEALAELAALAGRKGWVDLARTLYQAGANRQADLNALALAYADALTHEARFKEIREVLAQLESQAPENNPGFMVQLRQRQVITSAALNDSDAVREYTRRLAAVLNRDTDGIEICRRIFRKLGIADAVSELAGRDPKAPTTAAAARKQI
jgi:hypothetical protein